jgi:ribonuclease T2
MTSARKRDMLLGFAAVLATVASLAVTTMAVTSTPASAQRYDRAPFGGYDREYNPGRGKFISQPGRFDYYVLSLSWSPSYCAGLPRDGYDPQCHRRDGKRYAFVLHGLWPQFERGWPESCPSPDRGFVPRPVANRMLDIMPSDKLVFHEYRKHGVCTGLGVDRYFDLARRLYEKIRIPRRYAVTVEDRLTVSPQELMQEFVAANPGLKPDMLAVVCGGPGNRLREVRICFGRDGQLRACGRNEDQRKLCSAGSMYVPPVRLGAQPAPPDRDSIKIKPQQPLPGPRDYPANPPDRRL